MHKKMTTIFLLSAIPSIATAEDLSSASVPTIANILDASGISINGFIDTTYTALSSSGKYVGGALNNRTFDFERNSFNLNAVNLTISKLPAEGFGGLVDLTLGKDVDTIASYGTISKSRGPAAGEDQIFDVTQAYLNYAMGPITFMAGKFTTLAGAEVIKGPNNTNVSRSILFGYAVPFTHTGARATYKVNDSLSLIAGINNGWDDLEDTNSEKTAELGIAFAPTKQFSVTLQGYSGKEQLANYPLSPISGIRNLVDTVITFNATDKLSFIVNGDYGSQDDAVLPSGRTGKAEWYGVAGYINYQFTDQWRTSLRGEYFNDKDGYRTVIAPGETKGQKQKEVTLTAAYMPAKNAEFRAEVRHDFSDQRVFLEPSGRTSKNQNSFALEAIYKF